MTLSQVSRASGVSVSYLSAVEKGVNLPSLHKLGTSPAALGVGLPDVRADEGHAAVACGAVPRTRGTVDVAHPDLLLHVRLQRCRAREKGVAPVDTENRALFVYVREGDLTLTVNGHHVDLGPGDSLEAPASAKVHWSSTAPTVAVWTSCPARST